MAADSQEEWLQGSRDLLQTLGDLGSRASAKKAQICKPEVQYLVLVPLEPLSFFGGLIERFSYFCENLESTAGRSLLTPETCRWFWGRGIFKTVSPPAPSVFPSGELGILYGTGGGRSAAAGRDGASAQTPPAALPEPRPLQ